MKEVIVFSEGDSRKVSTWSGVPFFFTEALIKRGIRVNRVDLSPSPWKQRLFDKWFYRWWERRHPNSRYWYQRTPFHRWDLRSRIRRAIRQHPHCSAIVSLSFSFPVPRLDSIPVVLLGDWSLGQYISGLEGREPDRLELRAIRAEQRSLDAATLVVSLFPVAADQLRSVSSNPRIHYFGNAVNALREPDPEKVLRKKAHSRRILFVGRKKYKGGAKTLFKAFERLRKKSPEWTLDVVGMGSESFPDVPDGVRLHGFLDREIPESLETYYELLEGARVFVNPTPRWAAFSASLEALCFYTPVVVPPYPDFVAMFGEELNFGRYCTENTPDSVFNALVDVIEHSEYLSLCENGHQVSLGHSWDNLAGRILEELHLCD